jgi:glycosyltransferase involved in cell wall biosynthesis
VKRRIKALCITVDLDRPTTATFLGLQRAGVDVTVVCPARAGARAQLEAGGVRLLDIELRRNFDRAAIRRLRAELQQGRYDILHVFSNKALQNGLRAIRGLPVKLIAYRGIVGNVSFLSPVSWWRVLSPRIDRIVCVCNAVRDYFLAMRPAWLRMPPERPLTIYKGHSLDWYTAAPADRAALSVPPDAFLIGCVANYRPRKGIEILIDALGLLPADCPAHLLLVGNMESSRLAKHIARSPARERIHRLGHRRDAPSLTAACDVFVLPSIKREGLARSLIEAMAYGVAPVVTNCGGSPELVIDGESGLVVPVEDPQALAAALERLYRDPALRRRFGAAARARIGTSFRIEDTIARTLALYRELAELRED